MENPSLLTISNATTISDANNKEHDIAPRRCIGVPVSGNKVILSMDFKQIEQRVMAHCSNDKLLCQYLDDEANDFFETTAKQILGTSEKRKMVKAMVYRSRNPKWRC